MGHRRTTGDAPFCPDRFGLERVVSTSNNLLQIVTPDAVIEFAVAPDADRARQIDRELRIRDDISIVNINNPFQLARSISARK